MKKIIAILAVAAAALCFSACESNISGEFIYTVNVNASTAESMTWQLSTLGEPLIKAELKNAGGTEVVVTRLDSDGNVEIMKRTYKVKK